MRAGEIGAAVRAARVAAGLTQRALADRAGLSLGALRDLEQGRSSRPRPETVRSLAVALGLPTADPFLDAAASVPPAAPRARVTVRALGPLAVWDGETLAPVEGRAQALTLGLLALHADEDVEHGVLEDLLWSSPPSNHRQLLRSYVARLRRRLAAADADVVASPGRYRLVTTTPDACDVTRFHADLRAAEAATDPATETTALVDALELWSSSVVAGQPELATQPRAVALQQERIRATVRLAAAAVAAGRPDRAVGPVTDLAAAEPLDEGLAAAAVTVLAASGRMSDVQTVFRRTRAALARELGLDPGPDLARAFAAALRRSGAADVAPATGHDVRPTVPPAQLPRVLRGFGGRHDELAFLVDQVGGAPAAEPGPGDAPPVVVVSGMGGLGKTTLAVAAAHAVASRFPDGQLFTDLDGVGEPLSPAPVLENFLVALGHDRESLPGDLAGLVTTFRTATATARYLVVLDNAADAAQVEPLLPAGPGCGVVVTSRRTLGELDGAVHLPLSVLSPSSAAALLRAGIGAARTDPEPEAAEQIVALCGGLPLALRMVVARLTANPSWRLGDLAAMLAGEHHRLDVLRSGGRAVRASFELSHQALSPAAARVFRVAALIPGTTFAAATVAAALGDGAREAKVRSVLDDLVDRALLIDAPGGRYHFHDLVRAFAREQAREHADDSAAATAAVLGWLERTARHATALVFPHRVGAGWSGPLDRTPDLDDPAVVAAGVWLDAECATLAAAVTAADHPLAWRLADAASGALRRSVTSQRFEQVARIGLAAAEAEGDARGTGLMADLLARAHAARCDYEAAVSWFGRAADVAVDTGWEAFEVSARENLGIALLYLGRHAAATEQFEAALALTRRTGQRFWEAACRNDLGNVALLHGRISAAKGHYRAALQLNDDIGDAAGYAVALSNLGHAERLAGRPLVAWAHVTAVLEQPPPGLDRWITEETRLMQGEILLDLGRAERALDLARLAVDTTRRIEQPALTARAYLLVARAHVALGDIDRARDEAADGLDLARRVRVPTVVLDAHLALAEAALAADDLASAHAQAAAAGMLAAHLDDLAGSGAAALAKARVAAAEGLRARALGEARLAERMLASCGHGRGLAEAAAFRASLDAHPEAAAEVS